MHKLHFTSTSIILALILLAMGRIPVWTWLVQRDDSLRLARMIAKAARHTQRSQADSPDDERLTRRTRALDGAFGRIVIQVQSRVMA